VRRYVCAAALFLAALAPGSADVRIRSSPGGEVLSYLSLFELVRKSGERVIIDGPCQSACTLVLSVVPGNRICVARRAVLGFHAAIAVDRNGRRYSASDATQVITETYPAPVRAWIGRHGGLSTSSIAPRPGAHGDVSRLRIVAAGGKRITSDNIPLSEPKARGRCSRNLPQLRRYGRG